jgi:hypothetical protein
VAQPSGSRDRFLFLGRPGGAGVMASLFIPRARVILTPETETQSATLPILADPSVEAVFITGSIPSRELRVMVEGSQEAHVTGGCRSRRTRRRAWSRFAT